MKEKLRPLQIIHLALCAGLVLVYIFLGNLLSIESFKLPQIDALVLMYLLIPALAIVVSRFMFKTALNKIDPALSMDEKLTQYQSACIISYVFIEVAAFLIIFLKPELLLIGVLLIIYLFLIRPTADKIHTDLNNLT
ncbi:MFS transporter [Lacinutrix neustonica]|uniref:MFS transporter n=1 Tax=Lacinutrix neustonica TaxID=2980107 RepID=A0A9E8SEF9_9FLAO|nr:MFS transporter [Lacinutrix neustonica]WAC03171.1 MFS transporter [Lacinutrix neustonica]